MGTYDTIIKRRNNNNDGWDVFLPFTIAKNVLFNDGENDVEETLLKLLSSKYVDLNFSAIAMGKSNSSPDIINLSNTNIKTYAFDGTNKVEELSCGDEIPHGYVEGTDISAHLHWRPTTTNAGNIKWFIDVTWENDGDVPSSQTLSSIVSSDEVAWKNQFLSLGTLDGTGKKINSQLSVRIYRDPNDPDDTYPDKAALISFGFHVQVDALGSSTISEK